MLVSNILMMIADESQSRSLVGSSDISSDCKKKKKTTEPYNLRYRLV